MHQPGSWGGIGTQNRQNSIKVLTSILKIVLTEGKNWLYILGILDANLQRMKPFREKCLNKIFRISLGGQRSFVHILEQPGHIWDHLTSWSDTGQRLEPQRPSPPLQNGNMLLEALSEPDDTRPTTGPATWQHLIHCSYSIMTTLESKKQARLDQELLRDILDWVWQWGMMGPKRKGNNNSENIHGTETRATSKFICN